MSKKYRVNPQMLSNVLQAVADLKDVNGSTTKQILEQVRTTMNFSNVKRKPRNIVMQVRKALKHAVKTGILKMRAGKYKLILGQSNSSIATKKCKKSQKKQEEREEQNMSSSRSRTPDRSKRQKLRRKKKPKPYKRGSSCDSPSSKCYSAFYDSSCVHSYRDSEDDYVNRRSSGRRRSQKKNVRITQPKKKRGRKRKRTIKRKNTPIPSLAESLGGLNDDTGSFKSVSSKKSSNIFQEDEYVPQSLPDFPQDGYTEPMEMHPECDNRNCFCNFKQQNLDDGVPDDDSNY